MKLKDLQKKGAFVPMAPVEKELTWKRTGADGEPVEDTFTVKVKRQSFGSVERVLAVDPKDPERSRSASMIAESILLEGEDGKDANMSYAEAYSLEPSLGMVFLQAINDVNGARADATPKA